MEILITTPETISQIVTEAVARAIKMYDVPKVKQLPDRCYLPDACEITGLSESQVYKYTSDGKIPHSKFGKKLVFSRKDLKNWIESKTIDRQAEALNSLTNEAKRKAGLCR